MKVLEIKVQANIIENQAYNLYQKNWQRLKNKK
jgi:hypothetical protein